MGFTHPSGPYCATSDAVISCLSIFLQRFALRGRRLRRLDSYVVFKTHSPHRTHSFSYEKIGKLCVLCELCVLKTKLNYPVIVGFTGYSTLKKLKFSTMYSPLGVGGRQTKHTKAQFSQHQSPLPYGTPYAI